MKHQAFVGAILLYPNTNEIFSFYIPADSSLNANDGYISYGRTITDVTPLVYTADGTNVTDSVITGTPSISNNIVGIRMVYPTSFASDGARFSLRIKYTLDDGETGEVPISESIFTYSNQS